MGSVVPIAVLFPMFFGISVSWFKNTHHGKTHTEKFTDTSLPERFHALPCLAPPSFRFRREVSTLAHQSSEGPGAISTQPAVSPTVSM